MVRKHKTCFYLFQSKSLECGMATGCVKILKKAYEFDHLGKFIPLHKRGQDVDLFRGGRGFLSFFKNQLVTMLFQLSLLCYLD